MTKVAETQACGGQDARRGPTASEYRGREWLVRCFDDNVLDEEGVIRDTIGTYCLRFPVGTMHMVFRKEGDVSAQIR